MKKWLKLSGHGLALGLAAALIVPPALSAAPFALSSDTYPGSAASDQLGEDLLRVHCCHSHPYPPYDRYCCHGRTSVRVGAPVARAATSAAISYGAYRGVRSATKSAYKHGRSAAKKSIKRRR